MSAAVQTGIKVGSVTLGRLAPTFGFGLAVEGDPLFSFLGIEQFRPEFAKEQDAAFEKATVEIGSGIVDFFTPKTPAAPAPSAPTPPVTGGTGDSGGGFPFKKGKRTVKASDFKTPLKIAAVGGAVAAAGVAIDETAKRLGPTLNDALDTTGKAIENAAEGIGKGLDDAGKSVGDAFSFVLDPLGLSDEDKKNFGKILLIGGAVAIGLFAFIMVVKK